MIDPKDLPVGTGTPAKLSPELLHDVAKGGVPAAVLLLMGWLISNQLNEVTDEMRGLRTQMVEMQVKAAAQSGDRWTSADQKAHERETEIRMREMEARLTRVEAGHKE